MATNKENKPQEEEIQKPAATPKPENDNQGAERNEPDRNPVELSKKRQRKELRRDTGGDSGDAGAKHGIGEKIREDIRNDIDTAKQEIDDAKKMFTPLQKQERQQQTPVNGGLPVTGIQGEGSSSPEQAPAEDIDGIKPDEFAEPADAARPAEDVTDTEPAPKPEGQEPVQDPTLTKRVNDGYKDVATGVEPTNSASVKGTEKLSDETYNKTEQENKTFTEPAQEVYDSLSAKIASAKQDYTAAQEKYSVPSAQAITEKKIADAEAKKGSPLSAKERRQLNREAEREHEARKESIYKELDPNYKSSKDFKREQNIKTIIGAIGKLGTLAGKTVTAANSGILLPTSSFSDGIMEDVRISKKERDALLHAYDEIRQAKINEPLARLQEAEKNQLDLVKSGAAYQTGKTTEGSKYSSGKEFSVEKKKEPIDFNDWVESQGGAKNMFGKLQNGEYIIPDIYRNGMPSGAHKVTIDVFNNATGNLFDVFKTLPGVKTNADGEVEDENGNIWVDLHQLQEDIAGATEAGTREKLQQRYVEYLDKMLKVMEKSNEAVAKRALNDYSRLLKGASLAYKDYNGNGSDTGAQQGSDEVPDWIAASLN